MKAPQRSYRGKSSEARRAERRRQFIEAGCTVFGEVGFHAATVKQLCQAAGLTERYFYESFRRREALFGACYDETLDVLLREITAAVLAARPRELSSIARAGLSAFFTAIQQDRRMARIILIEIYGVPYDQERLFRRSIGRFADLVQQIALKSDLDSRGAPFDVELLATGLVGVCVQMAQRWIIDGYRQPPERLVDNCMLIFDGLNDRLDAAGR